MGLYDTFSSLQDRVREGLADSTDTFFGPNEFKAALNEGCWEIYKILHSQNRGYFFNTTPESITLTTATAYYTLTNDFGWIDNIVPTNENDRYIRFVWRDRHEDEFKDMLNHPVDYSYPNSDTYYFDIVADKTLAIAPRVNTSLAVDVYLVQEPAEMENPGDVPPLKKIWRHLLVEYAVKKLKGKEETGEYLSHDKLLTFLLENLGKYSGPRSGTNLSVVPEYSP